ncbi:MAG: DUF2975 domain-containing protein [Cyclobacteriaceae bacterium]|nr:DUF2975 domain-containing protein [Cyclobacteriaceae bacterium]
MGNYKILKITRSILNVYWYLQLLLIATIVIIGFLLFFNVDFINLNYLNGFRIHFSRINFTEPLLYNGTEYKFSLTNGDGRLHIDDLNQKFVYLRMLAAFVHSAIYLMIIYFLRKIFKNLTENEYFIPANGMYIKKIALSIILLSLIPELIHYLTDRWILQSIQFSNVMIKNEFNVDFQTILLGLLVFVISIIFLRGIELREDQKLTI